MTSGPAARREGIASALMAADYPEVLRLSSDVGVEVPPGPGDEAWRDRAYARILALVHVGREDEADRLAERCLAQARELGDEEARLLVTNASVWPAHLAGRESVAFARLDEVLAHAESRASPPERARWFAYAGTAAGSVGFTEVCDELLGVACAILDMAPPGAVPAALMRYLRTAQIAARFGLAVTTELDGSGGAARHYRGARELCRHALAGAWAPDGLPAMSADYYRACADYADVALGERVEEVAPPAPVDAAAPHDLLVLSTATIRGLARLRSQEAADPAARLAEAVRLAGAARRARMHAVEADACRIQLRCAEELGDPVLVAARREMFETALGQLDWRGRLQRAHLRAYRSRTLGALV